MHSILLSTRRQDNLRYSPRPPSSYVMAWLTDIMRQFSRMEQLEQGRHTPCLAQKKTLETCSLLWKRSLYKSTSSQETGRTTFGFHSWRFTTNKLETWSWCPRRLKIWEKIQSKELQSPAYQKLKSTHQKRFWTCWSSAIGTGLKRQLALMRHLPALMLCSKSL